MISNIGLPVGKGAGFSTILSFTSGLDTAFMVVNLKPRGSELVGCKFSERKWETDRRTVYQMQTDQQKHLEVGNCGKVTKRGREACECTGWATIDSWSSFPQVHQELAPRCPYLKNPERWSPTLRPRPARGENDPVV
jgi:hypothetical protein